MGNRAFEPDHIPSWNLYGENWAFPDILHCEKITDRAADLDWVISPHRHPHLHQFFLIQSGAIEITMDGSKLRPQAPCVMTIPRGAVHGFVFSAGTDGFVVTIPHQILPEVFGSQSITAATLSMYGEVPADSSLTKLFHTLHREHDGRNRARATMLKAHATIISCEIFRRLPPPAGIEKSRLDAKFQKFEELIQAHFREGWRVGDYAQDLNLSPRHLGRLCKKATGQSPIDYLDSIVMREACRLLVYTRGSNAEIGYQLGFDDPSYFSRAFRRHMGKTPSEYRAMFVQE